MIKAVINIEAPRHHVYTVLSDFLHYNQWLPGCVSSKVISVSGNIYETEITLASIKTMTMGLRYLVEEGQHLNYQMVKGKDLKAYSGSWRLMDSADGSGTVVMGEMDMDAGAMVPAFMVTRMVKKAIDEAGEALKKRVRSTPVQAEKAAAPAGAVAPGEAPVAPKAPVKPRHKRIMHVMRIRGGYRVWMLGETYFVK